MGAARFAYLSVKAWGRFKNGGVLLSLLRTFAVLFTPAISLLKFG